MTLSSPDARSAIDAIELKGIDVIRRGVAILQDVSLRVRAGSCCAILGPNGSGKSALMAVLSGYLWPSAGTVAIHGRRYGQVNLGDVRREIGLIEPSRMPTFKSAMSVREVVASGLFGTIVLPLYRELDAGEWQRVEAELPPLGLDQIGDRAYGDLSSGERMKVLLARARVGAAQVLLLDEPTVGLDMGSRAACVRAMDRLMQRADPPTLVVVSHHLDELPCAVDQVVLMKAGRAVDQGRPEELLTSARLSDLFDCDIKVFRDNGRFVARISAMKE